MGWKSTSRSYAGLLRALDMLAAPPPWTSFSPLDFINAASSGARLGLERAGQTLNANEAADRLGLGYAQLAGENSRAATADASAERRSSGADALKQLEMQTSLAQWQQEMEQRKAFQGGEIASRNLRDSLALNKMLGVGPSRPEPIVKEYTVPGTNRKVPYLWNPATGTASWMHPSMLNGGTAPGQISRQDIERLKDLRTEQSMITKKWADSTSGLARGLLSGNAQSMAQKAADDKRLAEIQSSILGITGTGTAAPSAAQSLAPSPEAPLGWQPTTGGEWQRPILPSGGTSAVDALSSPAPNAVDADPLSLFK